jgi:hypothetical protein
LSKLDFNFEWEDPGGAKGEELRATWARLSIHVGDSNVTQAYDRTLNSIRAAIYCPLYPVAEWMVSNWWALIRECQVPGRSGDEKYPWRHNLRFAAEGFAMPWLEIQPTRGGFILKWRQRDLLRERVSFIQKGAAVLDSGVVEEALTRFVDSVITRLDEQNIRGTPLQDDWSSIRHQDAEEKAFCDAAGAMGLDPFDISDPDSKKLLDAASSLRREIQSDFFEAADSEQFGQQIAWVSEGLEFARTQNVDLHQLKSVKQRLSATNSGKAPWIQGYEFARQFRDVAGMRDVEKVKIEDLGLGDPIAQALSWSDTSQSGFDGVSDVNQLGSPGFFIRRGNEPTQRFALCRALFEYLHSNGSPASLVSSAISEKQKRNRAFAAELLAPAKLIRGHLSSRSVGQSDVEALAERFAVSTYVIAHQVENHHLGRVVWDPSTTLLADE